MKSSSANSLFYLEALRVVSHCFFSEESLLFGFKNMNISRVMKIAIFIASHKSADPACEHKVSRAYHSKEL